MIKLWSEITSGSSTIWQESYLLHKTILLKKGCEISGWKFLKFWFFYVGFYCIHFCFCMYVVQQVNLLILNHMRTLENIVVYKYAGFIDT